MQNESTHTDGLVRAAAPIDLGLFRLGRGYVNDVTTGALREVAP